MVRIRLTILRLPNYAADASFEAYADIGTGAIDYDHALPPGRVPFWPEAAPRNGHLFDAHLVLRHLDSVDPDGHLETLHLRAEHLRPAWPFVVESPAYVFGRFDHAVRLFDAVGNPSPDPPAQLATTVNSSPEAPRGLKRESFNAATGQVTFSFYPVRFSPLRGL
jgi:hypothetical protein